MDNPTSFAPQIQADLYCDVCGKLISHTRAMKQKGEEYHVCDAFDCNRLISQRASMSPAIFRWRLGFQRELLQKRQRRQEEEKQRIENITALHNQQEQDILQRVLTHNSQLDPRMQTIVIPSGPNQVTRLSESRRQSYLEHLQGVIEEAANCPSIDDVIHDQHYDAHHKLTDIESRFNANTELRNISDRLCALCKGGCCISGKDHAYLSTFSMRQQMERNPQWTQDELFEHYRALISTHTIEGSCINHTPNGCTLPRELRSDICNAFYCDTLKNYQRANPQGQPQEMIVFQRAAPYSSSISPDVDNDIIRVAWLQRDSISEVDCSSGEIHLFDE